MNTERPENDDAARDPGATADARTAGKPGPEAGPSAVAGASGAASDGAGGSSGGAGRSVAAGAAETAAAGETGDAGAEATSAGDAGTNAQSAEDSGANADPARGSGENAEATGDAEANPKQARDTATNTKPAGKAEASTEPARDTGAKARPTGNARANTDPARDSGANTEATGDAEANPKQARDTATNTKPAGKAEASTEPARDTGAKAQPTGNARANAEPARDSGANADPAQGSRANAEPGRKSAANAERAGAGRAPSGSPGALGSAEGRELSLPRDHEDRVPGGGGRPRTPVLVASVAAAVLLIGGGGAWLASHASGGTDGKAASGAPGRDGTPPPLALDGYSESAPGDGNGIAPGEPNPYGATYRVDGTLPDGPREAPVYRARGEVSKGDVARLAKALGLEGTPVAQGEAWKIGGQDGTGPALQVNRQAPGAWTFSRYVPGTDNCKGVDTCKRPQAGDGDPVGEAEAQQAASPVLKAVGQDDAKLDASQVMGAQRVVNAEPRVGGLPAHGWTTGITVGPDGEVVGGSGRLLAPVKGDTYPVVGAEKALELMEGQPKGDHRMGVGGCASPVPLKDRLEEPCGTPASGGPAKDTVTVEDAVFGLAAHHVDGREALVPSWLFEVRAPGAQDPFTVTYPAVDPKYLASPAPSEPQERPTSAPGPREVEVDGYRAEGAELTVSFTGGVCADYDVTAAEKGDEVTVTVTSTPWPDKVCVMIAKQFQKTVQLDEPLGARGVVDADGKAVPLAKEGARLPAPPTR
ncbi:hypothetical protein [Streptomyces djakartensis]|uniref:hypothetical protein n=1 Tax=Streptomyces djakartensis TaxID=68193 RepID=UPI003F7D52AF